ncbi:peroxiredoxin-like 2C isoform 2-T2 [Acanthopagrus schlegelii]
MAAGADPAAASCVKALVAFVERGKALLERAETQSREDSPQDFIRQKIRIEQKQSLLGLIEAAADLYRSLSVKKKADAEHLWRINNHCAALRAVLTDFKQLEMQWDSFLQRLDDELQLSAKTLERDHPSKCVSPDTSLISARTGEEVRLEKYLGRGKKILLVLIRQFSCLLCRLHLKDLEKNQEGALHWLQETGCQYDMLLDPERKMYAAFGLGASLKKVLNFSNMLLYAEYVADDMEFPRELPSIQDDMFQLGGDFVLGEHGRVLFSHCCQSPIDRPSVDLILSAVGR